MADPAAFRAQYLAAKKERARREKPRAKPKVRKAPEPGLRDYAASGLSALQAMANPQQTGMDIGLQLGQALPGIASDVADYFGSNSPMDVLSDVGSGLRRAGGYMLDNPVSTAADFTPIVGDVKGFGEDIQRAAELRAAGNPLAARNIERLALPLAVASIVPGIGEARGAGKMAVRAADDVLPDLAVRDIGLGQKMYTTPEGSRITVMEDAKFAPRKNSITDFVVPEELRGQGRGGALLDAALQKYDPTEVSAAASSPSSAALLYKRGFRPAGEPNADLARALEIMKEDSSVTMVVPREPQGIIAYHGSPHSFDRFDISKIGTGEGAQAYGRGLYFAGNEDVARQYRDDLQRYEPSIEGVVVNHPTLLDAANYSFSVDDYVESLQRQLDRARQTYASTEDIERELADIDVRRAERKLADLAPYTGKSFARTPTGSMYQVRLNVRPEDLLDWDTSFTPEGLESFAAKFDAVSPATRRMLEDWSYANQQRGLPMPEGADVMLQLSGRRIASPELSQMLREAGVPGVQYLDQGSRSAGDGTRNYVMFGDDMIDLLRKYAIGGRVNKLAVKH